MVFIFDFMLKRGKRSVLSTEMLIEEEIFRFVIVSENPFNSPWLPNAPFQLMTASSGANSRPFTLVLILT